MRFSSPVKIAALEHIASAADSGQIFPVTPGSALARMAAQHPAFQMTEDFVVHIIEDFFTGGGSME
jgi:hypothetical protein